MVAAWCQQVLDRRLAEGELTDHSRLVALRAGRLVSRQHRLELAAWWEDVPLRVSGLAPVSRHAVRPSAAQVGAAGPQIDDLVATLRSGWPMSARSIASAGLLLTDGTGPLFQRNAPSLAATLRDVLKAADPFAALRELPALGRTVPQ
jgi:hypothetical protein